MVDGDDHDLPGRVGDGARRVADRHAQGERARPGAGHPHGHAQLGVEAGGRVVLEVQHAAHEHHAVALLHARVGEPRGAEQLGLGDVEQARVGAVAHDADEVGVLPAGPLGDLEGAGGDAAPVAAPVGGGGVARRAHAPSAQNSGASSGASA